MFSFKIIYLLIFVTYLFLYSKSAADSPRPHIIFILADDLGWNDVGFHGSNQIPTPNIDALAYAGLILNRYYTTAICTPSRSALMTGMHPIHTGMQHTVIYGAEPHGLPLNFKLLPEYLKELGYTTKIVGKWHLGHYKLKYTPTYRGFDSHMGFWTGHHDYFDHTAVENHQWGLDMRNGTEVAWDLHGCYSTDVFTQEAVKIIDNHDKKNPLFLYVSHAAVHSGNPYNPLPAWDVDVERFSYIEDYNRRKFAAILSKLDKSVGEIVEALGRNSLLDNSIIIFSSDNGGPAAGFNLNAASNWPLRGVKNTLFEGGVRAAGLIWSPYLNRTGRVSEQVMHIADWLPTLITAAGGNASAISGLDGVDVWTALSEDTRTTRTEILHNIDDIYGNAALTVGNYKILKGSTYNGEWDYWYGPSGLNGTYDINEVLKSMSGKALQLIGYPLNADKITQLRNGAKMMCRAERNACNALTSPCIFNIVDDPCEHYNLADELPHVVAALERRLAEYNATAVPPGNKNLNPKGNPKFWDYTWTNFGDYSQYQR